MNIKLHGNCACIQPPFSAYRTQLTGKESVPFKRMLNFGLETYTDLKFTLYLYLVSAIEGGGNT
jgi:hypothetical protein